MGRMPRPSSKRVEGRHVEARNRSSDTMAFMFETRAVIRPTRFALESAQLQHEYFRCWEGLAKNFTLISASHRRNRHESILRKHPRRNPGPRRHRSPRIGRSA